MLKVIATESMIPGSSDARNVSTVTLKIKNAIVGMVLYGNCQGMTTGSVPMEKGEPMRDNIMYYPAIVLMIVEAAALVFLIVEWFKAKRRNNAESN